MFFPPGLEASAHSTLTVERPEATDTLFVEIYHGAAMLEPQYCRIITANEEDSKAIQQTLQEKRVEGKLVVFRPHKRSFYCEPEAGQRAPRAVWEEMCGLILGPVLEGAGYLPATEYPELLAGDNRFHRIRHMYRLAGDWSMETVVLHVPPSGGDSGLRGDAPAFSPNPRALDLKENLQQGNGKWKVTKELAGEHGTKYPSTPPWLDGPTVHIRGKKPVIVRRPDPNGTPEDELDENDTHPAVSSLIEYVFLKEVRTILTEEAELISIVCQAYQDYNAIKGAMENVLHLKPWKEDPENLTITFRPEGFPCSIHGVGFWNRLCPYLVEKVLNPLGHIGEMHEPDTEKVEDLIKITYSTRFFAASAALFTVPDIGDNREFVTVEFYLDKNREYVEGVAIHSRNPSQITTLKDSIEQAVKGFQILHYGQKQLCFIPNPPGKLKPANDSWKWITSKMSEAILDAGYTCGRTKEYADILRGAGMKTLRTKFHKIEGERPTDATTNPTDDATGDEPTDLQPQRLVLYLDWHLNDHNEDICVCIYLSNKDHVAKLIGVLASYGIPESWIGLNEPRDKSLGRHRLFFYPLGWLGTVWANRVKIFDNDCVWENAGYGEPSGLPFIGDHTGKGTAPLEMTRIMLATPGAERRQYETAKLFRRCLMHTPEIRLADTDAAPAFDPGLPRFIHASIAFENAVKTALPGGGIMLHVHVVEIASDLEPGSVAEYDVTLSSAREEAVAVVAAAVRLQRRWAPQQWISIENLGYCVLEATRGIGLHACRISTGGLEGHVSVLETLRELKFCKVAEGRTSALDGAFGSYYETWMRFRDEEGGGRV